MRLDFYICRHGQTDRNVEGVWQGCKTDVMLNKNGMKQAEELGKKFCMQAVKIYSSPLIRAVQTANAIATANVGNGDIVIMQNLRECDFGDAEGRSFVEVEQQYGQDFVHNIMWPTEKSARLHFLNGESKQNVFERVSCCLKRIASAQMLEDEGKQNILVVCHAGVFSALQYGYRLKDVSYDNCATLHLQYDTDTHKFVQCVD